MAVVTNIQDLRAIAMRKVPRAIFHYADRGSYDETTLAANRADLAAIGLRQRVMIDVSDRSTATTLIGEKVALPLAIAPTGLTGLFHGDGEIHGCRAAQAAGIPFTLSTMSICSIEDVAGAVDKPFWFQLYVMRDRKFSESLVERAKAAKCSALVLTLDLQIQGQRHNDIKNGLAVPPKLTLANALDIATKPRWIASVLMGRRHSFGNLAVRQESDSLSTLSQWIAGQFDPSLSWKDVEWVRSIWPGKLILKGILDVEDAKIAAQTGADAIVVSNHGGRQLDGAVSTIKALPRIVDAIGGGKSEIWFDGGVQSGQDILKARALGAKGCMMGKAFLWSLAAGGQAGVAQAIEIIRKELDVSMALTGTRDIEQVDRSVLEL
ncbi:alpha-hydroxy-acid oxidizing protein [Ancylobacter dichloromethanicus]|uniref:Alpha-hydroxy-acid oxidizing enzyme n=1 Tax=Ancylobacter dichloromethanicus TaxID=518825 RepID=A0A9W6JC34_9HYPH|nr:alpha-hydroxy acid oxidase [Ancylobacter dichloromethanicus]MBS7552513.1 alpha-hydroxy-acid oxidizing protein [Ancylobacter dichloromethanicus]GLK74257.1 alpha-hydroxy-acid oxidizing enzyme [Ancylobacter dichloromethanicus]